MKLLHKYREYVLYVFFGGCTTVINLAVYQALYSLFKAPNLVSTVIAWLAAVIFAFVTNRKFVFRSTAHDAKGKTREAEGFLICRILTGLLELPVMHLTVDVWLWNSTLSKLVSGIISAVLNYVVSKFLIFK